MKTEENKERWEKAIAKSKQLLELYLEIPTGLLGASMIKNAINRYENGDRTVKLLKELEGFE